MNTRFQATRRLLVAFLPAVVLAAPANAELINVKWDFQSAYERTAQVETGKFVEVCTQLTLGQTVAWSFKSQSALNFNIHYHEGQKVIFPEKRDAVTELRGELKVPLDQDYCWMWSNKLGTVATLSVRMRKS